MPMHEPMSTRKLNVSLVGNQRLELARCVYMRDASWRCHSNRLRAQLPLEPPIVYDPLVPREVQG
eukprot:7846623-Pyramimonas_sp.AAC.1